jgi:hypothetical protein
LAAVSAQRQVRPCVSAALHMRTGRWPLAYACASEAARIAADTGAQLWQWFVPDCMSYLEAARGRDTDCRAHATQAITIAGTLEIDYGIDCSFVDDEVGGQGGRMRPRRGRGAAHLGRFLTSVGPAECVTALHCSRCGAAATWLSTVGTESTSRAVISAFSEDSACRRGSLVLPSACLLLQDALGESGDVARELSTLLVGLLQEGRPQIGRSRTG